jgi:NAD-dependent dihydropyrimidine dehydrogenase PreA subunit
MQIDFRTCTACENCIDYCPADAIEIDADTGHVSISEKMCFECGLCLYLKICPVDALYEATEAGEFPHFLRALFSNPNTIHRLTLVPGRGTEESKTNDVTGRIGKEEIGLCIELGRPGLGSSFKDISLATRRLKELGFELEPNNPLTVLLDNERGGFCEAVLEQHILSAIIEVKTAADRLEEIITAVIEVGQKIDTVFSLGVICRFGENMELPIMDRLVKLGIGVAPNAKINLGMGRPLIEN